MKQKLTLALATALLCAPALAGSHGKWFDKTDTNQDGYLTADELGEKKAHKMAKIDTDGDARISRAELDAYKAAKHAKKKDEV
ncbi:MAG: hypothetical protein AB8G16_09045 [Gammaproteobacteria bacterium]